MKVKEIHGSMEDLEKIMEKASVCEDEVRVCDVFACITQFIGSLPGTGLYDVMVECCGGDKEAVEHMVAVIYGSIIATLLVNLSDNEDSVKA